MDKNFTRERFRQRHLEWLAWIGQPMLYDGSLCVERDYDPCAGTMNAVSLDGNNRIKIQYEQTRKNR